MALEKWTQNCHEACNPLQFDVFNQKYNRTNEQGEIV